MRISDWSSDVCSSDLTGPTPERYKDLEGGHTFHGRITRCDPPRLLSYSWGGEPEGGSEVTFELTPRGGDVLLVQIGRASCRDRVCQYVKISVVAVSLKKKIKGKSDRRIKR